ncbi:MAG: AAA family ATPase [Promethearchaeota archaeon]
MSFNINEVLTPNLRRAKEQALLLVKAGQSIILRSKEGEFTALSQALAKELDQSLILHSLALLSPDKKNFEDISSKKFIIFSSQDKLDVMESTRVNGAKLNLTDYQYPDEIIKLINPEAILITNTTAVMYGRLDRSWVTVHVPGANLEDINFLAKVFSVDISEEVRQSFIGLDLPQILSKITQLKCGIPDELSDSVEAVPQFSDLIGLEKGKKILEQFVLAPIRSNRYDLITPGVLLHGPPGNGKTSLVLALKEIIGKDKFYEIRGEEYQYNIYNIYESARIHRPAVVFIDDFDVLIKDNAVLYKTLLNVIGNPRYRGVCTLLTSNAEATKRALSNSTQEALFRFGRVEHFVEAGLPTQQERERFFQEKLRLNGNDVNNLVKDSEGFPFAALDYLRRLWELKRDLTEVKNEIKSIRKQISTNGLM